MKTTGQQNGFSLIELMVGLVVGLFVSGIIISTFVQSKRNYNQDETLAKLQENGRYALHLLSKELSMAGFAGNMQIEDAINVCTSIETAAPCIGIQPLPTTTAVCGIEWSKITEKPVSLLADSSTMDCLSGEKSGTSIVIFRRVAGKHTNSDEMVAGKIYFRTNGRGGAIILSDGSDTPASYTDWEYLVQVFYIKGDVNAPDGLYRKHLSHNGTELTMVDDGNVVPGLFDVGTIAGQDLTGDGTANQYVSATAAANIVSIQLDVLMASEENDVTYENEKTYTLANQAVNGPGASYHGRVFSKTIPIRNAAYRIQMENISQ